jgi:diguanylate cyclase (GGDEF)-like protein
MSLFNELRELEAKGIDLIEVLGHDRHLESPEVLRDVIRRLRHSDEDLHVELLNYLTYRRFPVEEAEGIWRGIMAHKQELEKAVGREVSFRVAALDYLEAGPSEEGHALLKGVHLLARPEFESILSFVHIDEVSGVHSRRYFNDRLAEEVSRARRYRKPLSLLLLDLDGFKQVNDACGHLVGDAVLKQVGRLLKDSTRQTDAVCRFGGDEFALLLPETDADSASVTAERIRQAVMGLAVSPSGGDASGAAPPAGRGAGNGLEPPRLTLSIGGSCYPSNCEDAEELVALADQMCLEAKRAGKNCVRIAEPRTGAELAHDH